MTEWRWIEVFAHHLRACALTHGEVVAVLSESSSRPELVETSRILDISARLIVNRAALKTDDRVAALVEAFRALVAQEQVAA